MVRAWILVLGLWAALLVGSPLLLASMGPGVDPAALAVRAARWTYLLGGRLCHQRPERSFHLGGTPLPVCGRCTGLYVGALVGAMFWATRRRPTAASERVHDLTPWRRALLAAGVLTVLTIVIERGGLDPGNRIRAAAALPLGGVVGALVTAGLRRELG